MRVLQERTLNAASSPRQAAPAWLQPLALASVLANSTIADIMADIVEAHAEEVKQKVTAQPNFCQALVAEALWNKGTDEVVLDLAQERVPHTVLAHSRPSNPSLRGWSCVRPHPLASNMLVYTWDLTITRLWCVDRCHESVMCAWVCNVEKPAVLSQM